METGDAWRNQRKIQVIALIDVVLGVLFIIFYLYYAICFLGGLSPLPAEELSVHLGRCLVLLVGVLVFLVNGWQIRTAFQLFQSLRPDTDELDDAVCVACGWRWLKTSIGLLLIIAVKFFLLTLIPLGETNNFDFFLCLVEFLFRIGGLYFVKELLDDVAAAEAVALTRAMSTKSRKSSVGGGAGGGGANALMTPGVPRRQHASIEIPLDEIISNTTMKIVINTTAGPETHSHPDRDAEHGAGAGAKAAATVPNAVGSLANLNTHKAEIAVAAEEEP